MSEVRVIGIGVANKGTECFPRSREVTIVIYIVPGLGAVCMQKLMEKLNEKMEGHQNSVAKPLTRFIFIYLFI